MCKVLVLDTIPGRNKECKRSHLNISKNNPKIIIVINSQIIFLASSMTLALACIPVTIQLEILF